MILWRVPANIYLFKVNIRNTRERCETCSKLTIKPLKLRQWCRSDVFIVNFEHISYLSLVFLLLPLNIYYMLARTHFKLTILIRVRGFIEIRMWNALHKLVPFVQFKNVKNTDGGGLLSVKLQASNCNFLKVTLLHWCFSRFLNCANDTKSVKASHMKF